MTHWTWGRLEQNMHKYLNNQGDVVAAFETGHLSLADLRQQSVNDVGHFVFGQRRIPRATGIVTGSARPASATWR